MSDYRPRTKSLPKNISFSLRFDGRDEPKEEMEKDARVISPGAQEKQSELDAKKEEEKKEKRKGLKLSLTLPLPEPLLPSLTELPYEVSVWTQKKHLEPAASSHAAEDAAPNSGSHKKVDKEDYLDLMEREKYNFSHLQPLVNFVESCFSCTFQETPRNSRPTTPSGSSVPSLAFPNSLQPHSASCNSTPRTISSPHARNSLSLSGSPLSSPRSSTGTPSGSNVLSPFSSMAALESYTKAPFCRLLVFKRGIEPCWEDKLNRAGGNLTLYFRNLEDTKTALFTLISLLFDNQESDSNQGPKRCPDDFCGFVVSGEYLYLQLWHGKKENREEWNKKIEGLNLLSKCWKVKYRVHKKCIARNTGDDEANEEKKGKGSQTPRRGSVITRKEDRKKHRNEGTVASGSYIGLFSPRSAYTKPSDAGTGYNSFPSMQPASLLSPRNKVPEGNIEIRTPKRGANKNNKDRFSWHKEQPFDHNKKDKPSIIVPETKIQSTEDQKKSPKTTETDVSDRSSDKSGGSLIILKSKAITKPRAAPVKPDLAQQTVRKAATKDGQGKQENVEDASQRVATEVTSDNLETQEQDAVKKSAESVLDSAQAQSTSLSNFQSEDNDSQGEVNKQAHNNSQSSVEQNEEENEESSVSTQTDEEESAQLKKNQSRTERRNTNGDDEDGQDAEGKEKKIIPSVVKVTCAMAVALGLGILSHQSLP